MMLGQTLLSFIAALALLVFVHELGHYLAARACGVKVLRFSIGFGKPLALWRIGPDRTEWVIAAIPLGGFVRMLDERDPPPGGIAPGELSRAFTRQTLGRRSLIVVAGPVANFLLAIALYAALAWSGVAEPSAIIESPPSGSPAATAGFERGDRVVAVDGTPVRSWNELRLRLLDGVIERRPVPMDVERQGSRQQLTLSTQQLPENEVERDFLRTLGLDVASARVEIVQLPADSAAAQAGLRIGDVVVAADGVPVARADALITRIRESAGRPVRMTVRRGDAMLEVAVVPQARPSERAEDGGRMVGRIGAALANRVDMIEVQATPIQAMVQGVRQTWDMSVFSLRMLGRMLVGQLSWKNLSGPVTIADYAGQSARIGWQAYVAFMALISVSLGVLNLLPVPVLDGGHLVYYGLEAALRRPLSVRFVDITQRAGMGIILAMMVLALFNDITRLLG